MRQKRFGAALWACLVVVALAASFAAPAAAQYDGKGAPALEWFDKGVKHYRVGEYAEAAEAFGRVLELQPDARLALIMRQRAGLGQLLEMLKQPQLAPDVQKLLALSEEGLREKQRSAEEIQALIRQFTHEALPKRWLAKQELIACGPYAVPFLLDYLDTERDVAHGLTPEERVTIRAMAHLTIKEMGVRALEPLLEALRSPSVPLRGEVCRLLAERGDARAFPALARLAEDPQTPERLRADARKALAAIAERTGVPADRRAAEAALALAESYYYADPRVIDYVPGLQRVIWRYEPKGQAYQDRILYVDVPQYAYNELMVEKLICEALGIGPTRAGLAQWLAGIGRLEAQDVRRALLALLAADAYRQVVEARDLAAGAPVLAGATVDDEARRAAAERVKALESAQVQNRLMGAPVLSDALARLLKDSHHSEALLAIADLAALADTTLPEHENGLLAALYVGAPAVRFAATEALLRISPEGTLGEPDQVVANIIAACHTQVRPNVAVVTRDKALYDGLASLLHRASYTSERLDGVSAVLERTRNQLPFVSMIVLDARASELPLGTAVATLRDDGITRFMPLIVLSAPDQVEAVRAEAGGGLIQALSLKANPEDVAGAIQAAFEMPSAAADTMEAAQKRLIGILRAVSRLDSNTDYPVAAAAGSISNLLTDHPDEVRVPAAEALAAIGAPEAYDRLVSLFLDQAAAEPLRLAAGRAAVSAAAASYYSDEPVGLDAERRRAVLAICEDAAASEELRATAVRLFAVQVK